MAVMVLRPTGSLTHRERYLWDGALNAGGSHLKFFVGVAYYRLDLSFARSLKDKRQVVRSLIDRLGRSATLSAAEAGDNDVWKTAVIAVSCVSSSHEMAKRTVEGALDLIEREAEVVDRSSWVFSTDDGEA